MHLLAVIFVILSVWGEVEFPAEEIPHIYGTDGEEDADDGQLRCYSCNTLLGDSECERLGNDEKAYSNRILKCPQTSDEVRPTCIFRKDNELASVIGLQVLLFFKEDDNVRHLMVIEDCRGEECKNKPSTKHPFLRNLEHRPSSIVMKPAELLKYGRSNRGSYRAMQCFKLNADSMDGRGFTIRGCANINVDGCLVGNYIDTDEFECHLCNEQLCNGVGASFLSSYVTLITFCKAIRIVIKLWQ